jgi:hypothetical protein
LNMMASIVDSLGRDGARWEQPPEQRSVAIEPHLRWPIVIDSRAAYPIDRPRQPHRTIIAADYTPATIADLHRDKDLTNIHGLDSTGEAAQPTTVPEARDQIPLQSRGRARP